MTYTLNNEKNGVELHFTGKPDASILSAIKAAGFRWLSSGKLWYAKQTPERLALAQQLTTADPVKSPAAQKMEEKSAKSAKPTYEMKYTFGGYRGKDGKYTSCRWSLCLNFTGGVHAFEIEAMTGDYGPVPTPQGAKFENNSDSMTDYFEHSSWFISPACPDFLGVLEAYEKQQAHDAAKRAKRDEKRGEGETREQRIAYLQRLMGYTYGRAEESVNREDENEAAQQRREFEFIATTRKIAEEFRDARAVGDVQAEEAAQNHLNSESAAYREKVTERENEAFRASNLCTIETAKKRGQCVELSGVAFVLDEVHYQTIDAQAFATGKMSRPEHKFTVLAIDAATGDHIGFYELNSEEERRKKMAEIVNNRAA